MASGRYKKSDNPVWNAKDFKRAKPASEVFDSDVLAVLVRPKGRPPVEPQDRKKAVSIRLHREIIAHFEHEGPGWQTRLNTFLLQSIESAKLNADGALQKAMAKQEALATNRKVKSHAR